MNSNVCIGLTVATQGIPSGEATAVCTNTANVHTCMNCGSKLRTACPTGTYSFQLMYLTWKLLESADSGLDSQNNYIAD